MATTVLLDVEGVLFKCYDSHRCKAKGKELLEKSLPWTSIRRTAHGIPRFTDFEEKKLNISIDFIPDSYFTLTYNQREEDVQFRGSFFDNIFNRGDWRHQLDKDGRLFIDRDAAIFPVILNFLRDGTSIPIPRDDYTLGRILQEARFFHLFDLCDLVERTMSYAELPIKKNYGKQQKSHSKPKKEVRISEEAPLSMPSTPTSRQATPILSEYSRRLSAEVPIPIKKSTLEKRNSGSKKDRKLVESISLPRNFAHVAHVGWNGRGVIFQKHLLGQEQTTVRAIIDAASDADLTPVYNVVNGDDANYGSHSVEVVLAGPHMNVKEQELRKEVYSRPKKNPPKPPTKPSFERPASK